MTPRAVISVLQKEDVVLISRSEVLKGELVMMVKGEGASEDDSVTRGHKSERNRRRQCGRFLKTVLPLSHIALTTTKGLLL